MTSRDEQFPQRDSQEFNMSHINCQTCRFTVPDPESDEGGACHRYPPTAMIEGDSIFSVFPLVSYVDVSWCGEYSPKAAH